MKRGCIQTQIKKRLIHRLKIMQGQIRGLEKAIENEEYCLDVLNQSSAIQESLKSFGVLMLENHLRTHVADQFKNEKDDKAVAELLKVYKLNSK